MLYPQRLPRGRGSLSSTGRRHPGRASRWRVIRSCGLLDELPRTNADQLGLGNACGPVLSSSFSRALGGPGGGGREPRPSDHLQQLPAISEAATSSSWTWKGRSAVLLLGREGASGLCLSQLDAITCSRASPSTGIVCPRRLLLLLELQRPAGPSSAVGRLSAREAGHQRWRSARVQAQIRTQAGGAEARLPEACRPLESSSATCIEAQGVASLGAQVARLLGVAQDGRTRRAEGGAPGQALDNEPSKTPRRSRWRHSVHTQASSLGLHF